MNENTNESTPPLSTFEKNIYYQVKKKIFSIVLNAEYNMIMNFIKDINTLKTFFVREMHGISVAYNENDPTNLNEFILILSKRKDEILKLNDFFLQNIESKKVYINNYIYKVKLIDREEWENHKNVIFRFEMLNKINDKESLNRNKIKIKNKSFLNSKNFIDVIISFYSDINNNNTVLINEIYYDLDEIIFQRFYDITTIFYEKVQHFINKNFKAYLCNESILINRSILQLYNYIISRKFFYDKRFVIKDIQKFPNEINIFIVIQDNDYPESVYQMRYHIS